METQATVRFSTGQLELFGMENFGVAFNAPGIVTIGPNLRILGVSYLPVYNQAALLRNDANSKERNSQARSQLTRKLLLRLESLKCINILTSLLYSQAHYNLEVTSWDYTQRYPNPDNDVLSGLGPDSKIDQPPGAEQDPDMDSPFSADVTVHGDITARV
jgi:hypothetical protein